MQTHSLTKRIKLGLAGAIVGLIFLAAAGIARRDGRAEAGPDRGLEPPVHVTPTPSLPPNEFASIAIGTARLQLADPGWGAFIAAVAAGDIDRVLSTLDFRDYPCTPAASRDGHAARCAELGLPDGASTPMFPEDGRGAVPLSKTLPGGEWFRDSGQMRELLGTLMKGRNPRLDLIASLGTDEVVISFAIDPVAVSPGGPQITSVSFRADQLAVPRLQAFALSVVSTTPFETLRGRERAGQRIELWGISDELRARDAAIHSER